MNPFYSAVLVGALVFGVLMALLMWSIRPETPNSVTLQRTLLACPARVNGIPLQSFKLATDGVTSIDCRYGWL